MSGIAAIATIQAHFNKVRAVDAAGMLEHAQSEGYIESGIPILIVVLAAEIDDWCLFLSLSL